MFVALDIGNSRIKSAVFKDHKIIEKIYFKTPYELINHFKNKEIHNFAISSVVPSLTEQITQKIKTKFNVSPFIINHNSKFNLRIEYQSIKTLGIDRISSAEGAFFLFKQRKEFSNFNEQTFLLSIDFGTATTINLIKYPGIFIGGMIAPGIKMMLDALNNNTAQLPVVDIDDYDLLIGNSSKASIASGVINSAIGLIERTINFIKQNYNADKIKIYITGGAAEKILNEIKFDFEFEESLVLQGIKSIWEINK